MHLTSSLKPVLAILALLAALLAGCAGAPVQEMSDARQALQAAEEMGAPSRAPDAYESARELLHDAEIALNQGNYRVARERALAAKAAALEARQKAVNHTPNP